MSADGQNAYYSSYFTNQLPALARAATEGM